MKQIILILLGAGLGFFGFTIEGVFHETTSMVAATMFFAEAINDWQEFKKWKAGATAVGVAILLSIIGWQFVADSFLYGLPLQEFVVQALPVALGALGLWPLIKKATEK